MKKKLIIGLGLVFFISAVSAVVVIKNLNNMIVNQELINEQDVIIGKYNEMLFQMKGAQSELYRHQAGYSRNIDDLVNYIDAFDDNMTFLSRKYSSHHHDIQCMQCHSQIEERLTSLSGIFSGIEKHIKQYKQNVSILITTDDKSQLGILENAATERGNVIIGLLEKIKHAADKMRGEIKNKRNLLIDRSRSMITLTIAFAFAFSIAISLAVYRGITVPVNSLIKGIRKIASGDFQQRVTVRTKDEIGFMAQAFNDMTEQLHVMNREKDVLLQTLKEFNEDLEKSVEGATKELRLAQENMVRTETLAAIGTLAAGVSHELSTPLNSILGFAQLTISEMDDGSPVKGDLRLIEQEAMRCRRIVQGLLNFARPPIYETKLTDINRVIDDTITLVEYQPAMKKIILKRELDGALAPIDADPLQLKQVFLNLILNAIQAMPNGGELKLETGSTPNGVEAVISDTGAGISEEEKKKIFQPFYTTKPDGTGLGLSITYGIVKEHGGEIYVESSPGRGTKFKMLLPRKNPGRREKMSTALAGGRLARKE